MLKMEKRRRNCKSIEAEIQFTCETEKKTKKNRKKQSKKMTKTVKSKTPTPLSK